MSEDMSPSSSSWSLKHLVSSSSRLTSLKGYIADRSPSPARHILGSATTTATTSRGLQVGGEPERQGWRAWAGQKIRGRRKRSDSAGNIEIVNVFPGWAARRYIQGTSTEVPQPFDVEVFVSGYAISCRSRENITRSQRAFIRLAKAFASLPKLIEDPYNRTTGSISLVQLTPSTEALLAQAKLPPRPSEISDDFDVEALERQLKRATTVRDRKPNPTSGSGSELPSSSSSSALSMDMENDSLSSETRDYTSSPARAQTMPMSSTSASIGSSNPIDLIRRLHANLEQRLQPFWSSVLPNRIIRLHLFTPPSSASPPNSSQSDKFTFDPDCGPVTSQDVITGVDGSFQAKFRLRWDELCNYPQAVHIAFDEDVEHQVMVVAQLLPPVNIPVGATSAQNMMERPSASPSGFSSASTPGTYDPSSSSTQTHNQTLPPLKPLTSISVVPITHSPIRVISDIDDTVKLSNILSGARAVFHNVFVKELKDSVIPGMGEWYSGMWSRGVRFHYVSNGPFELLPILHEFFQISQLPPGSIRLKSYAGRSLFNGLLSAPAARKRAGVVDILDSFPDSRFFLIGDSGEQDLELYADLARQRPHMILGVLVRDVDGGNPEREPIDDPTGWGGTVFTRPSETPSIPIGVDSTAKNMSFMSNAHLQFLEEEQNTMVSEQTPRPNRYVFEDSRRQDTLLLDGALSTEPGSLTMDSGRNSMTSASSSRSQIYSLERRQLQQQNEQSTPQPLRVTQPDPIQPPRIPANSIPKSHSSFSSQSFSQRIYGQHQGSSSVSTANSSTSSFSLNNMTYGGSNGKMTEVEKRREELQMRVNRARRQMPSHIVLRVFREPSECVEVEEVMRREGLR